MVIVDTSVLIDYFGDRRTWQVDWLDLELSRQRIGITSLVLAEVLQGIPRDRVFDSTLDALGAFVIFDGAGADLAISSAQNYRLLRQKGIIVRNLVDTLTATFCIEGGHELLHNDREFERFQAHLGLQVVPPPAGALKLNP
jgi:hypothetical protein